MTKVEQLLAQDTPEERSRLIDELEGQEENPLICVRLTKGQTGRLAKLIGQLPFALFQPIALRYAFYFSDKKIAQVTGIKRVNGTIAYGKDRLTQLMGLPRPIAPRYWKQACEECIQSGNYPHPPG